MIHFRASTHVSKVMALIATTVAGAASAQVEVTSTSFEEPPVFPGARYTDTGDPLVNHPLVNNPEEPYLNYVTAGGEIGFSAFYTNTRNDVGLTDGDFVGVTDFTGVVGAYPDGLNGYQFQDADGLMTVTFDTVSLDNRPTANVSIDVFVRDDSWEADDRVRVWVEADGLEIDLLNSEGSDIDDLGIEGAWITYIADLSGVGDATLRVELDSNAGSEEVYIDNVVFTADKGGVDLILNPPDPGLAGVDNSFLVSGAAPGQRVFYVYGLLAGSTAVPGCPDLFVDIDRPTIAGSAFADGNGDATLTRFVPGAAKGHTVLIQAVEPSSCRVSNRVDETF